MLACFADFGEVLTALVEEFGMDVTAKDFVCAMGLHHTLSRTYIHILHALSGVYSSCVLLTVVHVLMHSTYRIYIRSSFSVISNLFRKSTVQIVRNPPCRKGSQPSTMLLGNRATHA